MKLFALELLLSAFSSLTLTEVVTSFKNCAHFFIQNSKNAPIFPAEFKDHRYKMICQHLEGDYRFATLYDTEGRIPVYSAYTFYGGEAHPRNNRWKNEPELENIKSQGMIEIQKAEMDAYFHQAVNRDYEESRNNTNTEYTRGHVFPNQYAATNEQAESTFAFTNVAPQTEHSNNRWAEQVETPMRAEILRECRPNKDKPAYIVTGVVPGNKWIPITRKVNNQIKKIEQGVNIPIYYWTAYCCSNNNNVRVSKAYLSLQNQPDQTYELSQMSVNRLNTHLTELYKKKDFIVFGQLCLAPHSS